MKPSPVPVHTVCSACGLSWESHGEKPTLETCVELLKAELAKERAKLRPQWPYTTGTPMPRVLINTTLAKSFKPYVINCSTGAK